MYSCYVNACSYTQINIYIYIYIEYAVHVCYVLFRERAVYARVMMVYLFKLARRLVRLHARLVDGRKVASV